MNQRVWNSGSGDWTDPSRWSVTETGASGAPIPGDAAKVTEGDVELVGAEGLDGSIYNGVALMLGDPGNDAVQLDLSSAVLGQYASIGLAGSATIDAAGTSAIACAVTDAVGGSTLTLGGATGDAIGTLILAHDSSVAVSEGACLHLTGTIRADAAITTAAASTVVNDATVTLDGPLIDIEGFLTGTGAFDIDDASTLLLGGQCGAGQTIAFGDTNGRLQLANPGAFAGAITGFASGDLLDFNGVDATAAAYDAASGTLTLTDASGAAVATLHGLQAAPGPLTVTRDGGGIGTTVGYAGAPAREKLSIAVADRAMRSDVVRATMTVPGTAVPITGAGVKVGIISGSFDDYGTADADAAAGYLPADPDGTSAVTVLTEGSPGGTDEGREMAEEIHEVAPGARLYFAAEGGSTTTYAGAVSALRQAGCQIIVSDENPPSLPVYDVAGGLDRTVTATIAAGVNVFDSGGNFGQSFVEQQFTPQTTRLSDGTPAQAQIFSDGTAYEPFTVLAGTSARLDLQWTAPYEGISGAGAPQALTLKLFDADGQPLPAGFGTTTGTVQDQDGVATTDLEVAVPSAAVATTYEAAVYRDGDQVSPRAFKMMLSRTGTSGTGAGGYFDDPDAGQGSGDERGLQLIPGVNSVGASFWGNSAAFGGAPTYNEDFTNVGPGTIYDNSVGMAYATPRNAGKLDFDAPDGIPVPTPSSSNPNAPTPFYGTSAAAPNAAAVAALMLQADPDLTTAEFTALLKRSAIDQGLTAAQQGTGLIQADRAVELAVATIGSRVVSVGASGRTVDLRSFGIVENHHQASTAFVFGPGDGLDVIHGFKLGGADHDTIALPSADFANLAAVFRNTGDVGGSAFITDPMTGDAIRLAGVSTAELKVHPKDFALL